MNQQRNCVARDRHERIPEAEALIRQLPTSVWEKRLKSGDAQIADEAIEASRQVFEAFIANVIKATKTANAKSIYTAVSRNYSTSLNQRHKRKIQDSRAHFTSELDLKTPRSILFTDLPSFSNVAFRLNSRAFDAGPKPCCSTKLLEPYQTFSRPFGLEAEVCCEAASVVLAMAVECARPAHLFNRVEPMLKLLDRRMLVFTLSRIAIIMTCIASVTNVATGDEAENDIYRIEEDWEMKLNEPSSLQNSPQVTFFMKPDSQNDSAYFELQMNHAIENDYSSGGFHVAAVLNEEYYDEARSGTRQGLSVDTDTITWTNMIALLNQKLFFAIKNGHCSDWGAFGGPEYLVQMPAGDVCSLDAYQPEKSIADLDIGYGGNRVLKLELKTIRGYYRDGHVETIELNRQVER